MERLFLGWEVDALLEDLYQDDEEFHNLLASPTPSKQGRRTSSGMRGPSLEVNIFLIRIFPLYLNCQKSRMHSDKKA